MEKADRRFAGKEEEKMKFYRNEHIEEIADRRLREFEAKMERPVSPPIDIELFGELVLGLSILWEKIDELPGEEILAGLRTAEKLIIMNEDRRAQMDEKTGRCRLTQGHEMGHWDLFVDKSKLEHPKLFDEVSPSIFAYRSSTSGQVQIIQRLLACEEGQELLRQIASRADTPDEARSVNRYAAAILMPRALMTDEAKKIDRTQWGTLWRKLYPMADRYGVTVSALRVRFEQLNLLYVDQENKKVYPTREDAQGQQNLF
ncbi:MAG TPA: hypothetical protein VKZ53_31725 [Candidatus Angelobacter sp.]|nr:hypothetical protein [Candidatus Angelobacter sp.]